MFLTTKERDLIKQVVLKGQDASLSDIGNCIFKILRERGATVETYKANTGSIYMRIDYGVAGSIRIGDHKGKKHLKYKYQIIHNNKNTAKVKELPYYNKKLDVNYSRTLGNLDSLEKVVGNMIRDRAEKMVKYGKKYYEYMESNKNTKQLIGFTVHC
jgi:hypothetical protein